MSPHNIYNLTYIASTQNKGKEKSKTVDSENQIKQMLQVVANHAMKEKNLNFEELENILKNSLMNKDEAQRDPQSELIENDKQEGGASFTKILFEKGYLKDEKKWLTEKGFRAIGELILQDVMNSLKSSGFGLHETKFQGHGSIIHDTTKKLEPGGDLGQLNVSQTLLNCIDRISKSKSKIKFPLHLLPDDFEEYETLEEVKASVVYCIDLSSTMKYPLGQNGKSRIESAKRALWSLYSFNSKFFPNDSISIVGFASMASIIEPSDIPFLKTFDANDNFLHYTNYQAALNLARRILQKKSGENKRIVMITDGQPSACFVENEYQKNEILSEKPYSNFFQPDQSLMSKIQNEKNMKLDSKQGRLVYLCYRYKKVDPQINHRTILEAKKCLKAGIAIDTVVVSDEIELLGYVQELEKELKGKTYHIDKGNIDKILVMDYLTNIKKALSLRQTW